MQKLKKIIFGLIYALPAVLFCGYYPVIRLGGNESMNFELSLPLIWLAVFDMLVFVAFIWRGIKLAKNNASAESKKTPRPSPKKSLKSQQYLHGQQQDKAKQGKWGINFPGISDRKFFLLTLFPLYATMSIFWSANPVRALLTAGIIWLIFFAVFAMVYILPVLSWPENFGHNCIRAICIATLAICVVCWVQCFLDIIGVGREQSLLCRGCVATTFGFPHPSGLAIEPQFMGNLLLAPTLLALYLIVFHRQDSSGASSQRVQTPQDAKSSKRSAQIARNQTKLVGKPEHTVSIKIIARVDHILVWATAVIASATLFITFSRGAIYAYLVALAIIFIFAIAKHKLRPALFLIPITTFIFSLSMQGIFAVIGPTNTSFYTAITKSIHHLSLGIIDLRPIERTIEKTAESTTKNSENTAEKTTKSSEKNQTETQTENSIKELTVESAESSPPSQTSNQSQPTFDGYVAESTNVRLNLNDTALDTWLSPNDRAQDYWLTENGQPVYPINFSSLFFGVGLGGAGTAMHRQWPERVTSPKEIVQNQPISILLELGLVGAILIIFSLLIIFYPQIFPRKFIDGRAAFIPTSPSNGTTTKSNDRTAIATTKAFTIEASQKSVKTTSLKPSSTFWSSSALPLMCALIIAYLITLQFFSGLPNALQVYLMPPLIYVIFLPHAQRT